MKLLLVLVAAAVPLAAQCTYDVAPLTVNLPASSSTPNTQVITVTTQPGCDWQATVSSGSFLSVYPVQPGPGPGQFGISAAQNPTNAARTGFVSVASASISVTQAAAVCAYTVSPATMSFPVTGGTGTIQVGANCEWSTGVSDAGWIIVPNTAQGIFAGSFTYTINANACLGSRTGAIGVGFPGTRTTTQLLLTQDGSPNNLSLSPATATIGPSATDGKVNLTLGANCPWSAFSDVSWLQITSVN